MPETEKTKNNLKDRNVFKLFYKIFLFIFMSLKELIQQSSNYKQSIPNPVEFYLNWKNQEGIVTYYDKEKKENVILEKSISFLLLDQLSTVRGWDAELETAVIGTEVRNPLTDTIILRTYDKNKNSKTYDKGLWKTELKQKYPFLNFHASLYIATIIDNKPTIANLQLKGAVLEQLFNSKLNPADCFYITLERGSLEKKGATKWHTVDIKKNTACPNGLDEYAESKYKELQEYLAQYLNINSKKENPFEYTKIINSEEPQADLPEVDLDQIQVNMPF